MCKTFGQSSRNWLSLYRQVCLNQTTRSAIIQLSNIFSQVSCSPRNHYSNTQFFEVGCTWVISVAFTRNFPLSQKYSEQYTTFRKKIASAFRWNHWRRKQVASDTYYIVLSVMSTFNHCVYIDFSYVALNFVSKQYAFRRTANLAKQIYTFIYVFEVPAQVFINNLELYFTIRH